MLYQYPYYLHFCKQAVLIQSKIAEITSMVLIWDVLKKETDCQIDSVSDISPLSEQEIESIKQELSDSKNELDKLKERRYRLQSKLDYDAFLKRGFSVGQVKQFEKEDEQTKEWAEKQAKQYNEDAKTVFCFPINLYTDNALVSYLRELESDLPLLNGCGDPYEDSSLLITAKAEERKIIDIVAANVNIIKPYWGYITSGGTEGNMWGMREGKRRYPKSKIYFGEAAHYGVRKIASMLYAQDDIVEIPSLPGSEEIDKEKLISRICKDFDDFGTIPNLLLTFGTTRNGAIDNFSYIAKKLGEKKIPYYLHLDCAFFGGFPKNSLDAPKLIRSDIKYINSLSISFHKYFGSPTVNGILLAQENCFSNKIEYIGDLNDSTIAGSRSYPPFSLLKRVYDMVSRSKPEDYREATAFFTKSLEERHISYFREGLSNIFIVPAPNETVCKNNQLSSFTQNGKRYVHLIAFPNTDKASFLSLLDKIK